MKKYLLIIILFLSSTIVNACPACEKQQPKLLRGITHGTGPESQWDYVIVWITVIVAVFTLYYSIKWLIRPGERSDSHIKQIIFNAA